MNFGRFFRGEWRTWQKIHTVEKYFPMDFMFNDTGRE